MPRCGARLRLGARTGGRRATRATRTATPRPARRRPAAGRGRGRRETLVLVLYSHLAASSMVRTQKSPPLRRSPSSSWCSRQAGTERGAGGVRARLVQPMYGANLPRCDCAPTCTEWLQGTGAAAVMRTWASHPRRSSSGREPQRASSAPLDAFSCVPRQIRLDREYAGMRTAREHVAALRHADPVHVCAPGASARFLCVPRLAPFVLKPSPSCRCATCPRASELAAGQAPRLHRRRPWGLRPHRSCDSAAAP